MSVALPQILHGPASRRTPRLIVGRSSRRGRLGWCGWVGNAVWGVFDARGSDGRDEVEGANGVDAAIGVVEVDLEVSGGLLDIEEQQMAMLARDGLVGVRDGYGFGCVNEALADVGGVGLTRLLGRASNSTLFPVDGKAK